MNLYTKQKQKIVIDKNNFLGKGGEADVFKYGSNQVAKIFKNSNHPDILTDNEKRVVQAKLKEYQHKLPAFPTDLPSSVIAPKTILYDSRGKVSGYLMSYLGGGWELKRYSEKQFRVKNVKSNDVIEVFTKLRKIVSEIHKAKVVIGDFNDLNVIVKNDKDPYIIDADSFQFLSYQTLVYTTKFVDPRLCDQSQNTLILHKPHDELSDWYALIVMLFQSLLLTHPYGGIYKPTKSKKIGPERRYLEGISVFNSDVKYPKPAIPLKYLPDDTLGWFESVFDKQLREPVKLKYLQNLRWTSCSDCGVEHMRSVCPNCQKGPVIQKTQIKDTVTVHNIPLQSDEKVIFANYNKNFYWLTERKGSLYKDGKHFVVNQILNPNLKFRIQGDKTIIGYKNKCAVVENGKVFKNQSVDTFMGTPMFDVDDNNLFYLNNGILYKDDSTYGQVSIGSLLNGNTAFWVGPAFGFGFYVAAGYSSCFIFQKRANGINDDIKLSVGNGLIDANAYFTKEHVWFLTSSKTGKDVVNRAYLINKNGQIMAKTESTTADPQLWLENIKGKLPAGNFLLCPTDEGVVRVEVSGSDIGETKVFTETEPFVDSTSYLFPSDSGIYVVNTKKIQRLELKGGH